MNLRTFFDPIHYSFRVLKLTTFRPKVSAEFLERTKEGKEQYIVNYQLDNVRDKLLPSTVIERGRIVGPFRVLRTCDD